MNKSEYSNWSSLDLSSVSEKTVWGGECAAGIMTQNLTPTNFTIYTDTTWQSVGKSLRLISGDNGNNELQYLKWKLKQSAIERFAKGIKWFLLWHKCGFLCNRRNYM